MVDVSIDELVALHLLEVKVEGHGDGGCVSFKRSTPGIVRALDVDDTISGRVELLTTLASMEEAGLLVEDRAQVEGLAGQRNCYQLTDEGQSLASDVSRRVEAQTIDVVDDDDTTSVRLDAIDEELPDVTLVEALARTTNAGILRLRDETRTPEGIVGRQREFETLQDCIEVAQAGVTEAVFVAGESGIGKTTLVEHVLENARDCGFMVLTGAGTEDATEPYLPVRAALAEHREAASVRLFEADPTAQDTDVADLRDVADRRQALFADVGQGLVGLTADQPVALFLDDLHAADPGTLALLEYLATTLDDERILLIGAYRPEELDPDHSLSGVVDAIEDDAVHLELDPMDERATRSLVERALAARDVPREFVDTIHTRTGGHPLFVEATVRHLRERGVVDPKAGHYPADPDLPLPGKAQSAIERRLAALHDTARSVLDAASVVGMTVNFRVLSAVTHLPEVDLRENVDLLVAARIWTHETDAFDADGGKLAFANEVVRDAVREQLPDHRRRQLHERVAEALEGVHAGNLDAHAGTIARHYERADAPEPAIEYYRRAGDHAASVYAHETAVDNYERALALARENDRDEAVLSMVEEIGQVHFNAGEWGRAERYLGYLRERTTDPETIREIAVYRALIRFGRKEFEAVLEIADEALARWDGDSVHPHVCDLLNKKGWALMELGQKRSARELFEASREMADDLDDLEQRGKTIHALATLEADLGNVDHALRLSEEALEIADTLQDELGRCKVLNNLGLVHMMRSDLDAAREAFDRSLETARKCENRQEVLHPLINLSMVLEKRGEWTAARDRTEEHLDIAQDLDNEGNVAIARMLRGHRHLERGDVAAAVEPLQRALEQFREIDYAVYLATTRSELARLEVLRAAPQAALEHATAAREAVQDIHVEKFAEACARQGRVYRELDQLERALAAHETGLEHAQSCQSTEKIVLNRCGLALVGLLVGDEERALDQARSAYRAAASSQYALLPIDAQLTLGRVQHARGAHDESTEMLRDACSSARELGTVLRECEALYELGRLHHTRCAPTRARDSLEAALELAQETGATLFECRCENALEQLPDTSGH